MKRMTLGVAICLIAAFSTMLLVSTAGEDVKNSESALVKADKQALALFKKIHLGMGRGQVERILGPCIDKGSPEEPKAYWYIPHDTKIDEWLLVSNKGKVSVVYGDNVVKLKTFRPESGLLENLESHRKAFQQDN